MPTGPINCFGDVSPTMRPQSVFRISPENSMLRLHAETDGLERTGQECVGLVGEVDADPARPSPRALGVTVIVCSAPSRRISHVTGTSAFFVMICRDVPREHHALVVDGEDDVAGLQARLLGRTSRRRREHRRIDIGQHADVADLKAPLADGANRDPLLAAVAQTRATATSRSAACRSIMQKRSHVGTSSFANR